MEYVDWESRPRLLFRAGAGAVAAPKFELRRPSAIHAAACLSAAAILLFSSFYLVHSEVFSFLLVWAALSLLLGPFAPPSITGGDPRVGRGLPLLDPPEHHPPLNTDPKKQRQKIRSTHPPPASVPAVGSVVLEGHRFQDPTPNGNGSAEESKEDEMEEKEWTEEDFEILKKRISRHPAGEPRRWERISEAFNGRHSIDTVIKMAKSLSEKKPGSGDSYTQFLKQRKPLDKRVEAIHQESSNDGPFRLENGGDLKKESWSSGEDLALLKALKAFPKDAPMRWEKIAAAVPGKSKAGCMKRVTELKKDFRSSKASES